MAYNMDVTLRFIMKLSSKKGVFSSWQKKPTGSMIVAVCFIGDKTIPHISAHFKPLKVFRSNLRSLMKIPNIVSVCIHVFWAKFVFFSHFEIDLSNSVAINCIFRFYQSVNFIAIV